MPRFGCRCRFIKVQAGVLNLYLISFKFKHITSLVNGETKDKYLNAEMYMCGYVYVMVS